MKTATIVAMVMIIGFVSAFAAYDVTLSTQSKPDQVQVTNYSAAINSLNPQINAIKNNISSLNTLKPQISSINSSINSLGTVKSDISDIKGKLSDLETKIDQVQQSTTLAAITVFLDRSSYLQGDTIHITASGIDPQRSVQVQIVDSLGFITMSRDTSSDSAGKVAFDFPLSSTIKPGNFQVRLVSGQQTGSQPITIIGASYVSGVTLSGISYLFTAQTDKGVYHTGDTIEVSGIALPNSSITGVLAGPSEKIITSHTTAQSDGTYSLFYPSAQPFEVGSWHIMLQNQGLTRIVYLMVSDSNPPWPYQFTAQSFKQVYKPSDPIYVSGMARPYSTVDAVLSSPSGSEYHSTTTAGSDGTYVMYYLTTPWYETGKWNITVTNQGQTRVATIFIETSSSNVSDLFTTQTDKTIYQKGDQIQISGTAPAFSTVYATLSSQSGYTSSGSAVASFDGTYKMMYSTSPSFDSGNWNVTVQNQGLTRVVSIYLSP